MSRLREGVQPDDLQHFETAGRLTIDLGALRANWRDLAERAGKAQTAAVVKADAYGLGVENVVPGLRQAGCRTFFTAILSEARRVRALAPKATIYVFDGLADGAAPLYRDLSVRPVLGSPGEIEDWAQFCRQRGERLPAAVHIDTGMNRLGLTGEETAALAADGGPFEHFELSLVMTHLACGDTPAHPMNRAQVERFALLRGHLPDAPASIANSAGTLIGGAFLADLVRPGIAVYGGRAVEGAANPMRPVVTIEARILRIRRAARGETVGYGATHRLTRDSRLAILSAGYADGYFRSAGGADQHPGGIAYFGDHAAPVVGRVSMDLLAVDITDIPENDVRTGGYAEILGQRFTADDLAERAGTIGYEVLTSLGGRFHRYLLEA